ncbi:MAG TPA: STAS domain-containing protein [Flavobacteriales bacterium]|jgi:anti-sigma B factor antagonist|nr:STAS domain-containing protein [Flavobacteriales bacterium]HPH83008.1 STAS domain-containing protein [Flavobacteriales bacterium]
MAFSFELDESLAFPVFSLEGSLMERHEAQELLDETAELFAENKARIILDLQALDYLNSSGLNVLINIFTRARNAGGEVIMCNINDKLLRLLVITKLDAVIQQTKTTDEAIQVLSVGKSEQKNEA